MKGHIRRSCLLTVATVAMLLVPASGEAAGDDKWSGRWDVEGQSTSEGPFAHFGVLTIEMVTGGAAEEAKADIQKYAPDGIAGLCSLSDDAVMYRGFYDYGGGGFIIACRNGTFGPDRLRGYYRNNNFSHGEFDNIITGSDPGTFQGDFSPPNSNPFFFYAMDRSWRGTRLGATAECQGEEATIIVDNIVGQPVFGTAGKDVIVGTEFDDVIVGKGGGDLICGGDGDDVINGQGGNDLLFGGDGNDLLQGSKGDDRLFGGDGTDKIKGSDGQDLIMGQGGGDLRLDGGSGFDVIMGGSGGDEIDGGPFEDALIDWQIGPDGRGWAWLEAYYRRNSEPRWKGEIAAHLEPESAVDGNDVVSGGPHNDFLFEFEGDDVLNGESGDDILVAVGAGNDRLLGGGGPDSVAYGSTPWAVVVDLKKDLGKPRDDSIGGRDELEFIQAATGSPYDDILKGNGAPNALFGLSGDDAISGRGGQDYIDAGAGTDSVNGGGGTDTCVGAETVKQCEKT